MSDLEAVVTALVTVVTTGKKCVIRKYMLKNWIVKIAKYRGVDNKPTSIFISPYPRGCGRN